MMLLTKPIRQQLEANAAATRHAQANDTDEPDHTPCLKLFNPCGAATWLITEAELADPEDPHSDTILFGLADLGMGTPELGSISLRELEDIRLPAGLKIERDVHFKPTMTIGQYAEEARSKRRICA